MRSRRTAHDEMAAIARRRLELLSSELAGIRASAQADPEPSGQGDAPASGVQEATGAAWSVPPASAPTVPPVPGEPVVSGEPALPGEPGVLRQPVVSGEPVVLRDPGAPQVYGRVSGDAEPLGERPVRGRHALRPLGAGTRAGGWVHDRLPPTLQGRVALSAGHLTVVALLAATAFAVTAWWVVRAAGTETVVPAATWSEPTATPPSGSLVTPVAEAAAATESEPAVVVVDVAGKVRRPGIATLPLGSRVVDAIDAAGGVRRGVDLTALNLARLLVDGEQILVGVPAPGGIAAPAASAPGGAAGSGGPLVNINTAGQAELEELPGVGPVTASAILQWRTDNGPFTAVDELLEVSGIGDATLADMAPFVTL